MARARSATGPGKREHEGRASERGLLLVMQRGRLLGFDEGRPAGVYPTAVTLRGAGPARYAAPGVPFRVASG